MSSTPNSPSPLTGAADAIIAASSSSATKPLAGNTSPAVEQTIKDNPGTEDRLGYNYEGAKQFPNDLKKRTIPAPARKQYPPVTPKVAAFATNTVQGPASIVELSRALNVENNGPQLMYEWVYSNIEWEPGWGLNKGPVGSIADGLGNQFDQSALLAALLRQAGFTAHIVMGTIRLNESQFNAWFGTDSIWAARNYCFNLFIPVVTEPTWDGTTYYMDIKHVWVRWIDGANTWNFDPSIKSYTRKTGRTDLDTILGYNAATFMSNAQSGATVTTDYAQNLNRSGIRNNLTTFSTNLANWIKANDPDAQVDDLIGGQAINAPTLPVLQSTLPYQAPGDTPTVWTGDVPASFKPTLQVQFPNWSTPGVWDIDWQTTSDQLANSRLSLFYDGSLVPSLYLNGTAVDTGLAQPPGTYTSILLTVTHPAYDGANYPLTYQRYYQTTYQWWQGAIYAGDSFLIANAWGNLGQGQLEYHQNEVDKALAAGGTDTSEPVLGSRLAMTWYRMASASSRICDLVNQIKKCRTVYSHQVGVMSFKNTLTGQLGADIGGVSGSSTNLNNDMTQIPSNDTTISMHGVALEALTLSQVAGTSPGISATTIIDKAIQLGQKIYKGTTSNWNTGSNIQSTLVANGYSSTDMTNLYNWYIQWGNDLVIGENPAVTLATWTGWAYWVYPTSGAFGIINGAFKGGGKEGKPIQKTPITDETGTEKKDPVGSFDGSFILNTNDLDLGSMDYPYLLSFGRRYSSRKQYQSTPLGRGWTNNHDITARVSSDEDLATGQEYALPASSTLAELLVCTDILSDSARPIAKLATLSIADSWWIDQIFDNAVVVAFPDQVRVFIKLADGSFAPPVNFPNTLSIVGGLYRLTSPEGLQFNFNSSGQIATLVYPAGITLTYTYSGGNLTQITNGMGRTLTLSYTSGKLTSLSDGTGRSVSYSYDASSNLTQFTDANSKVHSYEYDQPGRMTKQFEPAFPLVAFVVNTYDSLSRVKTQADAIGNTHQFYLAGSRTLLLNPAGNKEVLYFNKLGSTVKEIDGLGNVTRTVYDGLNRAIEIVYPEGNKLTKTFDKNDNPLVVTWIPKPGSGLSNVVETYTYHPTWAKVATYQDGRGNTTAYSYDAANGNLLSIQKPMVGGLTPTVSMTYNARGQLLTRTDETNIVTKWSYDTTTERPLSRIDDFGTGRLNLTTSYGHDAVGNINSISDPRGNTVAFSFDPLRRLTQRTESAPFSYVTKWTFDDNGNTTKLERQTGGSPAWQTYSWTYSASNERLSATDPANKTATWTFNNLDKVQSFTDAQSRVWQYSYDANERISTITDPTSTVTETRTYTANGKLASVMDARSNLTQQSWDGFDRPNKITYQDATFEQNSSYDANGNVLTYVTRSGSTIVNTFDALNRLSTKAPAGQPTVTATYDLAGRLTQISKPVVSGDPSSGALQFFFDTAGRFFKEQYPDGKTVTHVLDGNGNITKTTYPDSYFIDRVYDQLNRLTNIKLNGSATSAATFSYNQLSQRTGITFSNGTSVVYTPQLNEDVTGITHNFVGSNVSFTYGFNNVHEPTSQTVSDSTYMWHPAAAGTVNYGTADSVNKYPTVGGVSYSYNGNKCLTGDGVWTFGYDTENHLLTASKTGTSASFVYDPMHRQSQKTVGSTKTRYVYSGWQRIADYNGSSGALQRRYVYGTDLDEPLIIVTGTTPTFLHHDKMGSIVAVSNNSGAVANKNKFSPFGEITTLGGTTVGFTGQRYDSELGLYYFKRRYYSPKLGRFLQPDPIGYTGPDFNLYTYGLNSPLVFTDPLGLSIKFKIPDWLQNLIDKLFGKGGNNPGGNPGGDPGGKGGNTGKGGGDGGQKGSGPGGTGGPGGPAGKPGGEGGEGGDPTLPPGTPGGPEGPPNPDTGAPPKTGPTRGPEVGDYGGPKPGGEGPSTSADPGKYGDGYGDLINRLNDLFYK
ncbi:MAG: RHS repeat-associated core domain-containing protein [Candidatus Competibacteraceae bacterium]|nr:RHS repeat-associated core domain-containing protein [Candidatus Competibacteraceae bacterium]